MKRRHLVVAAGIWGAVGAAAQPTGKVYRIGILATQLPAAELTGPQTRSVTINALLRGLRGLGYVYGEHFVTEVRSSEEKLERLPELAAELVALRVDLIVAAGPTLPALKTATSTIPIVMTGSGDPVGQGFVQSLARPGGNFTGLTLQSVDTVGKRLQMLREVVSAAGPIAVLWDRYNLLLWQEAEAAAKTRGERLLSLEIQNAAQLGAAFAAARESRASALLVLNSALFDREAGRIAALAATARLPAIYGLRLYVDTGGLMSYGPDLVENWGRAATFVDKILKGAKPADLHVEQPTKFELVINLKTAKALGLTVPKSLLLRADEALQ
jgi:putative ABC transport system substrate-binding protein